MRDAHAYMGASPCSPLSRTVSTCSWVMAACNWVNVVADTHPSLAMGSKASRGTIAGLLQSLRIASSGTR